MKAEPAIDSPAAARQSRGPIPILALDVPDTAAAVALLERIPTADFVKVGLQLFTAEGPAVVRELRAGGRSVFLDLKLHDIPNTVARAVESAARLDVQLLTLHASGGRAMLAAARDARGPAGHGAPELLAVTVLTSLSPPELADAWGRGALNAGEEAARLALLAREAGADGVVASVHEVGAIRNAAGERFRVLAPGIRASADAAGDQARIATPEAAARAGADYVVIGRAVTAASDSAAAYDRIVQALARVEGA